MERSGPLNRLQDEKMRSRGKRRAAVSGRDGEVGWPALPAQSDKNSPWVPCFWRLAHGSSES